MAGSGTQFSPNLAQKLRETANQAQTSKIDSEAQRIVAVVIAKAREAATRGLYGCAVNDEKLGDYHISQTVKKLLTADGFVVSVSEDKAYSALEGRTIMQVEVGW